MKVNRYIAFVLLVCFSAFLGHNLVPHHHHAEAFLNPIATDCPVEHEDHHSCNQEADGINHHSDDHPTHCHAFNDVVFEKHNTQLINPWSGQILVTAVSHTDLIPDPPVISNFYCYNVLKFPLSNIDRYGSHKLRGPPQTV